MLGKEGLNLSAEWEAVQYNATFLRAYVIGGLQFKPGRTTWAREVSFWIFLASGICKAYRQLCKGRVVASVVWT